VVSEGGAPIAGTRLAAGGGEIRGLWSGARAVVTYRRNELVSSPTFVGRLLDVISGTRPARSFACGLQVSRSALLHPQQDFPRNLQPLRF
jgi:hypothetical protein